MIRHRAIVSIPARESRGPEADQNSSNPPAPPAEPPATDGPTPAATPLAAPYPSVDPGALEADHGYLAPALKAAAAARARAAQIRAAASVAGADAPRPSLREWLLPVLDDLTAPPSARAALSLPPMPTEDPKMAEMRTAGANRGLSEAAGATSWPAFRPRPAAASLGLSVAEAARASRIAFRPVQGEAAARPAAPADVRRAPAVTPTGAPAGEAAAPVNRAASQASAAPETADRPTASRAHSKAERPAPARPVTRPGAARLLADEAVPPAAPDRAAQQQRFAKTIAELQRYQAATRPDEPWGKVVPRPAVPQPNPATSDSRWSRLWSRR